MRKPQGADRTIPGIANQSRKDETDENGDRPVMLVLPHHQRILPQVRYVIHHPGIQLEKDPPDVSPKEPILNVVRIVFGVRVFVMIPVVRRPVEGGVLERAGSENQSSEPDGPFRGERPVGEKPVVTERDTQPG